ncbi:putative Nodulation ABC transporter NodI [Streptomyces viridochromogenes Tue57]|uniref:Putative Nodulation ABC transporter NodI n=1 Tax=Streptomyces viridochromogenes Tue57 TaxID=1160705 RepID=L8P525_STRVR|nr:putative Nodulation ABC transporter NodI [Streptomyces viridochromogenes Tue57]
MTSIDVQDLTKEYGTRRAVDHLTFRVEPGRVTGFLGPNGAGKSTTMRLVLGLDRPTSGTATVGGRAYPTLNEPLRHVGALLDAQAAHGSRTGRDHLRVLAASNRIPDRRVDAVLEETGLASVARRRVKTYSLGMRQRLGIAAALLGDPEVVMLDEPSNGLDPEGIIWIRELLGRLAGEGRTVLVSSHLMNETASFADHLVVLGRGRLLADTPMREFIHARVEPASVSAPRTPPHSRPPSAGTATTRSGTRTATGACATRVWTTSAAWPRRQASPSSNSRPRRARWSRPTSI